MSNTGYLGRYLRGEQIQVWSEMTALGALARQEPFAAEVGAVARETMLRVRYNTQLLASRLPTVGYTFGYDWAVKKGILSLEEAKEMEAMEPVVSPPSPDVHLQISELELRTGEIPVSLKMFFSIVGGLNFVGSHDAWRASDSDPLNILSAQSLLHLDDWNHWSKDRLDDGSCIMPISPDEYSKYLLSGGLPYGIHTPSYAADVLLLNEWHHTTFVDYLRNCFRWGGLPGWERSGRWSEQTLAYLGEGLMPI